MKQLAFLLLSCLLSFQLVGQDDAFIDDIATKSCDCLDSRNANKENLEALLGLCVLQAAAPYKEEIKAELGIDIANANDDDYEILGELVGMKLAINCPGFVSILMESVSGETAVEEAETDDFWSDLETEESPSDDPEYGGAHNKAFITGEIENTNGSGLSRPQVEGRVKSINEGLINEIILQDAKGEKHTLYLTSEVVNAALIEKGAELTFTYKDKKMFNAATGQYIRIKQITRIN